MRDRPLREVSFPVPESECPIMPLDIEREIPDPETERLLENVRLGRERDKRDTGTSHAAP